jgi:hypothetical protein
MFQTIRPIAAHLCLCTAVLCGMFEAGEPHSHAEYAQAPVAVGKSAISVNVSGVANNAAPLIGDWLGFYPRPST